MVRRTGRAFPADRVKDKRWDVQTVDILPIDWPKDPVIPLVKKATTFSGTLAGSDATNGARFLFPFFVGKYRVVCFRRYSVRFNWIRPFRRERNVFCRSFDAGRNFVSSGIDVLTMISSRFAILCRIMFGSGTRGRKSKSWQAFRTRRGFLADCPTYISTFLNFLLN